MPAVLHVSQGVTDGLARYLTEVLRDQSARGWRLGIACPPAKWLVGEREQASATWHRWDARRELGPEAVREGWRLWEIVDDFAPDVVHLHSTKAGLVGRLVLRGRRPTIFTPHAWSFEHGGRITRAAALRWERWASRWATVVLCVSEAERARGERAGIRGRWRVVRNGVDLRRFPTAGACERQRVRDRFGIGAEPLALAVGRLVEQKGFDLLLDAWPEIRRRAPGARLALVGDGPMRNALEARKTDGVSMLGAREDVRDWLVACDVVVQPSRWEGLSLVTLESMATGRSVVATDVDGMSETLGGPGPDARGAIVPLGDLAALTAAVVERLTDPARAAAEGTSGRERAASFDLERWGDSLAAVTQEALSVGRASHSEEP
jgi:glycosyltransferase involved in cell wall biosynthesis